MDAKDNAPFLELPNGPHQEIRAPIFYGQTKVPHPVNAAAKRVEPERVMRAVREGK